MKEVLIWAFISATIIFACVLTIIIGVIKKKRSVLLISIIAFIFFMCSFAFTVYKLVTKSYNKVTNIHKPRTGEEIYTSLFGKAQRDCVKIINFQDQIVPKIDYAIWLQFRTCPEELERILSQVPYEKREESTNLWNSSGPLTGENWWKPESLGDRVLIFLLRASRQPTFSKTFCI
jgi:hypothetical protein